LIGVYSNTATYEGYNGVQIVPTKVMLDFVCEPLGGELTTSAETSECRWVPKREVLEMDNSSRSPRALSSISRV